MRIRKFTITVGILCGFLGMIGQAEDIHAAPLTIGAAPNLKGAFREILPLFEKEYGKSVQVMYGESPTLRRQIEKGMSIDVFLPAALEEVAILHHKGLTLYGGPRVFAQTSLVLVMSSESSALSGSFRDVLPNSATRIALGNPRTSSLGAITAKALLNLDSPYTKGTRFLYGGHGEDIVKRVHAGAAEVGIVYRVDAISNSQVRIIDETPVGIHDPIQFAAAIVWTCRKDSLDVAKEFVNFITSPRIQKLLLHYGFDSVPSDASLISLRTDPHKP